MASHLTPEFLVHRGVHQFILISFFTLAFQARTDVPLWKYRGSMGTAEVTKLEKESSHIGLVCNGKPA